MFRDTPTEKYCISECLRKCVIGCSNIKTYLVIQHRMLEIMGVIKVAHLTAKKVYNSLYSMNDN